MDSLDSLACWPGGMLSDTGSPAYSVDLSTLFGETYLPEGPQTWFILPIREIKNISDCRIRINFEPHVCGVPSDRFGS